MDEAVLTRWLAACQADPSLQEFAKNRQLSVQYRLSDSGQEFHTIFANGTVQAGLGVLDIPPDLSLKMTGETFDGLMSGRINGTTAAMSGKVRFSGDTMKAMPAQRIQKDLIRLYQEAQKKA
jgi:putative sterol carrier protein